MGMNKKSHAFAEVASRNQLLITWLSPLGYSEISTSVQSSFAGYPVFDSFGA